MRSNRRIRRLAGVAAAAAISVGVAAPVGLAQDPGYLPEPPSLAPPPPRSGPAPEGSDARRLQLKRCLNKAKAKYGDNAVKRKKAIKSCKKKYG